MSNLISSLHVAKQENNTEFKLNWRHILGEGQINSMEVESTASTELNLRAKFKEVFEEEMGLLQGTEASCQLNQLANRGFSNPALSLTLTERKWNKN